MKHFFLIFELLIGSLFAQGPPAPYSVVLTWTASATAGVTSQNVYRAPYTGTACGTYAAIASVTPPVVTYTDTSVTAGAQYCYEITALVGTAESGPDVNANNPVSLPPSPPSGLGSTVK